MNTEEIEKAICQDPSAEAIFAGVYARDQLPRSIKYPVAMVWNTDPANQLGEHWVAANLNEDGLGEYFDSDGLAPPPCFKWYMKKHSRQWTWNQVQLQDLWTSACGHFCVVYIIYWSRGIPMEDITEQLNRIEHNDQYVMESVAALL